MSGSKTVSILLLNFNNHPSKYRERLMSKSRLPFEKPTVEYIQVPAIYFLSHIEFVEISIRFGKNSKIAVHCIYKVG